MERKAKEEKDWKREINGNKRDEKKKVDSKRGKEREKKYVVGG